MSSIKHKSWAPPLSVNDLAARVAMSPRNFSRQFAAEFGVTPLRFISQLRVENE